MDFVFFSGHHRHTHEMAMRCHEIGARLMLPPHDTRDSFRHYAGEDLIPWLRLDKYGVKSYDSLSALKRAVDKGQVAGFFISLPEHITMLREQFGTVPIAADHMVNYFDRFREAGLQNFITPSRVALKRMNAPNQVHTIKVRDFEFIARTVGPDINKASNRSGFYSYIHRYADRWKRGYAMFAEIERQLAGSIDVRNFGFNSPHGQVDDLPAMKGSKATIHMKDGHVCCNAVIDSISVGTPVLIDDETVERLGLQDYVIHMVSGIRFATVDEAVRWITTLEHDDTLLDELSHRTYQFARLKMIDTSDDIARFRTFIDEMC